MSAPLGGVLAASAVVSSPVLWLLHQGSLTPSDAVQRWAVCTALCWVAITVVGALAFPGTSQRAQQQPVLTPVEEPAVAEVP